MTTQTETETDVDRADGGWGRHELSHYQCACCSGECDDAECDCDCDGSGGCCDGTCEAEEPRCVGGEDHAWHRGDSGGCDTNPGCWSLGGTSMQFDDECLRCHLGREAILVGWQRNPGECDSIRYTR